MSRKRPAGSRKKRPALPAITCIVNVRNGERYIRETLQSLVSQSRPVSALVVDNHSTDGTARIVREFPGVGYVKTPEPVPLGAARGFSLSLVETEYVAWLDADDVWLPGLSAEYEKAIACHPEALALSSGAVIIDTEGRPLGASHQRWQVLRPGHPTRYETGDTIESILTLTNLRAPWCAYVLKTEAVRRAGGFDCSLSYSEDIDLVGKLVSVGTSVHINSNLCQYRVHPAQDTRRLDADVRYAEGFSVIRQLGTRAGRLSEARLSELEDLFRFKRTLTQCVRGRSPVKGIEAMALLLRRGVVSGLMKSLTVTHAARRWLSLPATYLNRSRS